MDAIQLLTYNMHTNIICRLLFVPNTIMFAIKLTGRLPIPTSKAINLKIKSVARVDRYVRTY